MTTITQSSIRNVLEKIIAWDLIKKSQLILYYAIFLEMGLFLIQLTYLNHPLVNHELLSEMIWIIPMVIGINLIFIVIGRIIKNKKAYHGVYACSVMTFYYACLLFLHFMVGLLNLTNGVVFVGTVLASLLLFPYHLIRKIIWTYAFCYILMVYLTLNGYIDYALAFTTNALIHPRLEGPYVALSTLYSMFYITIILFVGSAFIYWWKEKNLYHPFDFYRDTLTPLLNEAGIRKVASLQLNQAHLTSSELSVVSLDLDNLKRLNEEYGREVGDLILCHVAQVLVKNLRTSDMIARLDGGAFMLVLAFTPLERAEAVAEMCRLAIEQTAYLVDNDKKIFVKASFGLSSTAKNGLDFDTLFVTSRNAMQHAKYNGKNQVCVAGMMVH